MAPEPHGPPAARRFRVALSFPGAKREYVKSVADSLAKRFGEERVLYDRFHTAEFATPDLAFNLPDLYRKDSDLIVVVLCGEYVEREWCGLEWRAIYAHIKEGRAKQVMLFRADDAEIRGLHGLEGFVPVDAFTPEEAVALILQRLAINEGKPRDFYLEGGKPSGPTGNFQQAVTRLPRKHDGGVFEGREQVLKDLDALWADALVDRPQRAQIVSLVAIGGAGKTTVASRWKDSLLAREWHGGVERYFDWSFYSQGTRTEGDNASAQTAADSTLFVAAALKFFGDAAMADSAAAAWDKGARLASLVAQHRTLLVLDGLEPLQHPPGPQQGELKDDSLRALFAGLQSAGRGLCLVTTREPIADLAATRDTTTPEWKLDHLTETAGALVLQHYGVTGPDAELRQASAEVKGHALTLALMGRYLRLAFNPPDIARRDCFHFAEVNPEVQNGHAFRVFGAYEKWFESEGRHVELAILRLLGLFDRPATPDCIAALCQAPAVPGFTEPLVELGDKQWNTALQRLRDLDLIETVEWTPIKVTGYGEAKARAEFAAASPRRTTDLGAPEPFSTPHSALRTPHSLDAHPLLREYFDAQLKERGIAPAAHTRLYEHLCTSVPYWPDGRDGLMPLYQAVAHGCKAGRFREALVVLRARIMRNTEGSHAAYSTKQLGLVGMDLSALSSFFIEPWSRLAPDLTPADEVWLLNWTAYRLHALNRLTEAWDPMQDAVEKAKQHEDWKNAADSAGNLSELEVARGKLSAAVDAAARAVTFADCSRDEFERIYDRTTHADALHQAGAGEASIRMFAEAERFQAGSEPGKPLLDSVKGFRYCDILLAGAERAAWQRFVGPSASDNASPGRSGRSETTTTGEELTATEQRATQTLEWANSSKDTLLPVALDHLTLGRVRLFRAILESPDSLPTARGFLDIALDTLRQSGRHNFTPFALLPSAWLHAAAGEWSAAQQRLDEAFAVTTRGGNAKNLWQGGMRLFLVDTLLHRARLFGVRNSEFAARNPPPAVYPWPDSSPAADLALAEKLINLCGYHRRDAELADAKAVIGS